MRAAVLRRFSEPLEVAEVPEPKVGADEVLVRVMAAGICGTDNKIASGAVPSIPLPPLLAPWRALMVRGKGQPGESVVVVGAGGLGLNAVQVARAAGARVAAIDPVPAHREEALRLGAELAVAPDQVGQVLDWTPGGADVV